MYIFAPLVPECEIVMKQKRSKMTIECGRHKNQNLKSTSKKLLVAVFMSHKTVLLSRLFTFIMFTYLDRV